MSSPNHWSITAISIGLLAIAASTYWTIMEKKVQRAATQISPQTKITPSHHQANVSTDVGELKALQDELKLLKQQISRLQQQQSLVDDRKAEFDRSDYQQDMKREHALKREQQQIQIENSFYQESIDPDWAKIVEEQLFSTFNPDIFANSTLLNVECRSTICRLNFTHNLGYDKDEFSKKIRDLRSELGEIATAGAMFFSEYDSTVYLANNGSNLRKIN